jgi:hypothetical protein
MPFTHPWASRLLTCEILRERVKLADSCELSASLR